MVNEIAPAMSPLPRRPAGHEGPAAGDFTDRKSNIAREPLAARLSASIAAQRRNLARSLLEWRLHGS
ncbi:hypothetical protein BKD09_36505 [Bradyrhizobium japonicum]|uniref:Uncharacterized protein n=1 Tax=Bradyrhizobium japonicum TaxID=375 RepID=A0A1L3FKN6_BRAJP|nr:hypothetical protein BKD09_36505 [Bradyrhizobium japonicum]